MTEHKGSPVEFFASAAEWESWLAPRCSTHEGIWVKIARKDSGILSVSYAEAVEIALCYGWIDGQKGKADEGCWLQRFTARTATSKWSKVNREKATRLIASGRMQPPGQREVDRAKRDGRWDAAYDPPSSASVPDDLQRALDANDQARAFFASLDSQNRYAILFRVHDAKKSETRARRIEKYVAMLARNEKIHP